MKTAAIFCLALLTSAVASPHGIRRSRAKHPKRCKADSSSPSSSSSDPNLLAISASLGATLSIGTGSGSEPTASPSNSGTSSTSTSSSASSVATGGGGSVNPDKHVFAHFMIGICSTYGQQDYVNDMTLAKSKGITGFALNIGTDSYTQQQLDYAYAAAQQVGFDVFISFDFNWYNNGDVSQVTQILSRYVNNPAQLLVDGNAFVSTFIGEGFDWSSVESQVGKQLYTVPYWTATASNMDNSALSGLFSWLAWPGQPNNVPVLANLTTQEDEVYISLAQTVGKQYMAPVSPWFFTHFGAEVSYSKNFLFYSETLWKYRWDQILGMGDQINFVEIITWNDFGESHYVGPYNTPHTDDGSSKWAEGFDHSAMLDFAVPYINAFKTGATTPVIEQEMMVFWYRPTLKNVNCDSTDNCGSKPTGWDFLEDVVFVGTMTTNGATVTVTSGSNAPVTQTVDAGVQVLTVPMGVGQQQFSITSNSGKSGSASPNVTISDSCWNGIYNYNYNSGSIVLN